jgi:Asp/Glu/hydantoin racemase
LTYRLAKTLGFDHLITTPIRALDIPVPEMKSRRKEAKQRMIELAKKGIEEGGQVIFPQGLNSLSVHVPLAEIEKEIGCPIVDAVPLAIKHAEIFVELGISQSKIAYPYHSS